MGRAGGYTSSRIPGSLLPGADYGAWHPSPDRISRPSLSGAGVGHGKAPLNPLPACTGVFFSQYLGAAAPAWLSALPAGGRSELALGKGQVQCPRGTTRGGPSRPAEGPANRRNAPRSSRPSCRLRPGAFSTGSSAGSAGDAASRTAIRPLTWEESFPAYALASPGRGRLFFLPRDQPDDPCTAAGLANKLV